MPNAICCKKFLKQIAAQPFALNYPVDTKTLQQEQLQLVLELGSPMLNTKLVKLKKTAGGKKKNGVRSVF